MGYIETSLAKVLNSQKNNFEMALKESKGGKLCLHTVAVP
jgi:hypothetical protein